MVRFYSGTKMITTEGKIQSAEICIGGHRNREIGLKIEVDTYNGAYSFFLGFTDTRFEEDDRHRINRYSDVLIFISELFRASGVTTLSQLINHPVKCYVDGSVIKTLEILKF